MCNVCKGVSYRALPMGLTSRAVLLAILCRCSAWGQVEQLLGHLSPTLIMYFPLAAVTWWSMWLNYTVWIQRKLELTPESCDHKVIQITYSANHQTSVSSSLISQSRPHVAGVLHCLKQATGYKLSTLLDNCLGNHGARIVSTKKFVIRRRPLILPTPGELHKKAAF